MLIIFIAVLSALQAALAIPISVSLISNSTHSSSKHSIVARGPGGVVFFENRCSYAVWVWSVSPGFSTQSIQVKARSRYTEDKRAPAAGGVVLKVSRSQELLAGKQTQFEYAIHENTMYYDISLVDCAQGESGANCPGWDAGLKITSEVNACRPATCPRNSYCPSQAYFVDTPVQKLGIPEPVYGCGDAGADMDLYFQTCSDNSPI